MGSPLLISRSLRQSIFRNFNHLFYGFCDSGVILKKLGQNLSFNVKSEVLKRGWTPLICVIKTWEYRSSLRKLIYRLRIYFINKNIRKKLKVLVAFLSNQKTEGN